MCEEPISRYYSVLSNKKYVGYYSSLFAINKYYAKKMFFRLPEKRYLKLFYLIKKVTVIISDIRSFFDVKQIVNIKPYVYVLVWRQTLTNEA